MSRCVWLITLLGLGAPLTAKPGALIIVGLSGDHQIAAQHRDLAGRAAAALESRGIPPQQIEVLSEGVTRDAILKKLDERLDGVGAEEEFWILLLGHGGLGRGNEVQFQVRGPRLLATDLQETLMAHESATPIMVLGFDRSGGFLPHLANLMATTIAATASAQERSLPRFTGYFVEALEASPDAGVKVLAARAAERTKLFYESQSLARSEESRLYDPASGQVLQPPFGVEDLHVDRPRGGVPKDPFEGLLASEIEIPKPKDITELLVEMPATDETRALIAEAQAAPNPEGFNGLILRRDIELSVSPTLHSTQRERLRVYLISPESFDEWANYEFPINPPARMTRIEAARMILPDGRSLVLGNASATARDPDLPPMSHLFFPGVAPGSIIELEVVTESTARQDIPAYYNEIYLPSSVPTLNFDLTLNLPKDERFRFHLANLDAKPTATAGELSRTYAWQLTDLPAYQPLPFDPPAREWVAWLGVSSLATWEDFTAWFSRIAEGAFDADPDVVALAATIAAAKPDREARIQAAYEYVAAMRYIAIEIGIQAFRPRTPGKVLDQHYGDCKDKANLLTALLREMGIPAHIALINRFSFTETDFPGWQFNHAIAYVEPGEGHPTGLWLDATETTTPYGELAPGNAGRHALVVNQAGESEFKLVQPHALIDKVENWEISPGDMGWKAQYTRAIDHALQSRLAGRSPQQRELTLLALIAPLFGQGETVQTLSVNDFGQSIHAEALLEAGALPNPNIAWSDAFLAPSRDRPLQLVEAPTRYTQVITLPAHSIENPPGHYESPEGLESISCSVRWSRESPGEIRRTALFEIHQPVIPTEVYADVRRVYRQWRTALNHHIPSIE